MGIWDKIKDYVGIGLLKAEKTGEYLKKTGREPDTNLQDVVSKVGRTPVKKKAVKKK